MKLTSLSLQDFRSHKTKALNFEKNVTLVVGPNASGKTSILEAIHLLSTGQSFRAGKIDEMVAFGKELARVKGGVEWKESQSSGKNDNGNDELNQTDLEIILTKGSVQGKRTQKRLYSVNDVRRRKKDFVSKLLSVVFRPEDLRLVEGSPGRRRSFLDEPLAMIDQEYARSLKTYDQALRRRNKLLEQVRENQAPISTLTYWNMTMIKHGEYIQKKRQEFISFCDVVDFSLDFSLNYNKSAITQARIEQYQPRAIAAGHTLIGPHKDDITVTLPFKGAGSDSDSGSDKQPISSFGSRGQQRLAVLWLKLAQLQFLEEKTKQKPLFLLDDILSELDEDSQQIVLEVFNNRQVIITSAQPEVDSILKKSNLSFDLVKL